MGRSKPRQCGIDKEIFIKANTEVSCPPHVPEIRLHLAGELNPIWRKTEEELEAIGIPPPFWAFAWAGGQGLARHILDNPDLVSERTVLDFACGSGLVGIAAAKAGASAVLSVDIDPICQQAVNLNASINNVRLASDVCDYVGKPVDQSIILAGDVFYDRPLAERLKPWFTSLSNAGKPVLVGDPGRAYVPKICLRELAVYEVSTTRELEDNEVKRTTVWRFT